MYFNRYPSLSSSLLLVSTLKTALTVCYNASSSTVDDVDIVISLCWKLDKGDGCGGGCGVELPVVFLSALLSFALTLVLMLDYLIEMFSL